MPVGASSCVGSVQERSRGRAGVIPLRAAATEGARRTVQGPSLVPQQAQWSLQAPRKGLLAHREYGPRREACPMGCQRRVWLR